MDQTIAICQFIEITPAGGRNTTTRRYQNYFIQEVKIFGGKEYSFAPFQIEGGVSSLNGDNEQIQLLCPATEYVVRLVEYGEGNRKSTLAIHTRYITGQDTIVNKSGFSTYFVGIGASFSEDTMELRFRSALDGVTPNLPGQTLTAQNAGILPLDSQLSFR